MKGTEAVVSETATPTPPTALATRPMPVVDAVVLDLVRTQANRELRVAQRWQTALVWLVTLGVSYAIFEGRFEGGAGELMGAFWGGLSMALSVAGLATLQTNLATAPKRA